MKVRILIALVLLLASASFALAQENRAPVDNPPPAVAAAPLVTATASAKRVRFVAPGTVVQLRLEVFNEAGQKLFDTELHGGNVLDWHLLDGAGQQLPPGSYASLLTIKSLSGRLSQRMGIVTVSGEKATVEAAAEGKLSLAQQQTIGSVEANTAFTVLQQSEAEAVTAVTHDGADGQVSRTRGALSFRRGDFFAGKDQEQMRLTEEGNLGVGTSDPQAKLDVAGVIRTRDGIEFGSGPQATRLSTTANGSLQQTLADGSIIPTVAGSGTQDRLAKWTDNSGTLGDSLLRETGGGVELRPLVAGIGVNPTLTNLSTVAGFAQFRFYPVAGPNTNMSFSVVPRGTGTAGNRAQFSVFNTDVNADATNYEFAALRARGTDFVFGSGKSGAGVNRPFMFASGYLSDNTTNNGQFYLASDGNVGVGTTNPAAKLDVAGKINAATEYLIGGSRVLSVNGTANTFAGINAGTNSTGNSNSFFGTNAGGALTNSGSSNSFFGSGAGASNTNGNGNAFFGTNAGVSNTAGLANSFFGLSTGQSNTTGTGNSFFGTQAGISNTTASDNSFFGRGAGAANTTAPRNSFFGRNAGAAQTSGGDNSFFGASAGESTAQGNANSFFGSSAGQSNLTFGNSFFGYGAGANNTTAFQNAFFGYAAGQANVSGGSNSFFGANAGLGNTIGNSNSFFGSAAGGYNTTGNANSFFGVEAGLANTTADFNSFFGRSAGKANTAANNSFFGARAGELNTTGGNNSFVGSNAGGANTTGGNNSLLGSNAGGANTTGGNNSFVGSNAGLANTTGSDNAFFGRTAGDANTSGNFNAFYGSNAGGANIDGGHNSFFGTSSGSANLGSNNSFFGRNAGNANTTGSNNTIVGMDADVGANNLTFATAIGSGAVVNNSNYVVLGRPADAVRIPGFLDVKGNTYLKDLVASNGDFSGRIVLDLLGAAGSTDLCWNIIKQIATCSSSLRYKTNVNPFLGGLDVVRRLRPITFNWKDGGTRDIGFAAEEVNEIEPLLSTHNAQGEIEGVKYKQITTVLVNAVKEQQQLIEQQQQQLQQKHQRIEKLETRLAALEAVVRKIGPGFTAPGELRNHRTRSVLRSRAPGRQPTRRLDRLVPAFITSTEYISSGSAWW